jgi:hypothetical protein
VVNNIELEAAVDGGEEARERPSIKWARANTEPTRRKPRKLRVRNEIDGDAEGHLDQRQTEGLLS